MMVARFALIGSFVLTTPGSLALMHHTSRPLLQSRCFRQVCYSPHCKIPCGSAVLELRTAPIARSHTSRCAQLRLAAPRTEHRSDMLLRWQVMLAGLVCVACFWKLAISSVPAMLAVHVGCMALLIPLGVAAISSIKQRKLPPKVRLADAKARKRRAERFVIRHFATSALAMYASAVGMVAIFRHKQLFGRPHLRTSHAWSGVVAFILWLAAYLGAQVSNNVAEYSGFRAILRDALSSPHPRIVFS